MIMTKINDQSSHLFSKLRVSVRAITLEDAVEDALLVGEHHIEDDVPEGGQRPPLSGERLRWTTGMAAGGKLLK
jgi:hypothetical protein